MSSSSKKTYIVKPVQCLRGEITVPGDKSISHRSLIFGALARGVTKVHNALYSQDCLSTASILGELGVKITFGKKTVLIYGQGEVGFNAPNKTLNAGNSGTTMRLLTGLLAGQNFSSTLTGDSSLRKRPMKRVVDPLKKMGAIIRLNDQKKGYAPIHITGSKHLKGMTFANVFRSAQVKSALLLAGLNAKGITAVKEDVPSRDHTERMMRYFGIPITHTKKKASVRRLKSVLRARSIIVPGDISSAAFFMVAASLVEGSSVLLRNVGINPTRTGILTVLKSMGAKIDILRVRGKHFEPYADIRVRYAPLKGAVIPESIIPSLVDELPILMVAACFAEGTTFIHGASELKVKETDRIHSMVSNLKRFGAQISSKGSSIQIRGGVSYTAKKAMDNYISYGDHRTAMSMIVALLCAQRRARIDDINCIDISYPSFIKDISSLKRV